LQFDLAITHRSHPQAGGMQFARLFIPNPRNLTEKDVKKIYESAF